jgi:hypothetical protein
MSIKLRFTTMQEACMASVSGTSDSVCLAIQGEQAKPEYFGNVSDAKIRVSHLNTIRLLASKASKAQKEALQKAVQTCDASTYHDYMVFVKAACTKDATAPISTGKGETRQITENVVAPNAEKIANAVAFIATKKANDKANMRKKKQPQASSTNPVDVPEAVKQTYKVQAMTALTVIQTCSAVAEWKTKDKLLPDDKKADLQGHIEAIANIVKHMTN